MGGRAPPRPLTPVRRTRARPAHARPPHALVPLTPASGSRLRIPAGRPHDLLAVPAPDRPGLGGTDQQDRAHVDLGRVQRVVDEATWSMARARAILDGRPLPAPPTTLRRTGNGGEPAVDLDDDDQPVYVGSRAPYSAGWFGVGSGLFGGLLMGSMLGGFGGWVVEDIGEGADREDGSATDW